MSQLTLDFQPALPERFPTLREYIAHRATVVAKMPKVQAADTNRKARALACVESLLAELSGVAASLKANS